MNNEDFFIGPDDMAKALRLGRSTIYRHIKRGFIKHVRIGKCIRIPLSELERIKCDGLG